MAAIATGTEVPRTNVASHKPVIWEDGMSSMEFFTPSSEYFGRQITPPENKTKDGGASMMAPMSHFHVLQTETFYVESGSGLWHLHGKTIQLNVGEKITIPRYAAHRFENLPDSKEQLSVLWRYDPPHWEMQERFFRNFLSYLDDCRKNGVQPSLFQMCIFMSDAWMPPDMIQCPGGDYVKCLVNTLFMWVMAFIGRLIGYKSSYNDYYDPAISRQHILEQSKKGK